MMVEAAPVALLVVDEHGRVTRANRMAELLLGRLRTPATTAATATSTAATTPSTPAPPTPSSAPAATLIGASIDQLVPPGAPGAGIGAWHTVVLQRGDGVAVALDVLRAPFGAGGATLTTIVDATERRRHEQELQRSNTELAQLAHVAAHELQEPLRMVASYAELLGARYRGRLDAKASKYLDHAVDGARRMQRLVTDLLRHARVGSRARPFAPVALDAVLAQVHELFATLLHDAKATVEIRPLPAVLGDADQLFRVFQNLIGNALKFRAERPLVITIDAVREADHWRVSVADNGLGVAAEDAARIFELFERVHTRDGHDGSGLGLALVQRIVEHHRGRVWVDPTPGQGATFHLTLVAVDAPAPI